MRPRNQKPARAVKKKVVAADIRLSGRFTREAWPIPAIKRPKLVDVLVKVAEGLEAGRGPDTTDALRAHEVLLAMDKINQGDAQRADTNERLDAGKLTARTGLEPVIIEVPI